MKLTLIFTLAMTGATLAAPTHQTQAEEATTGTAANTGITRFTSGMRASSKGGLKCFIYWFDNAIDNPLRKIGGPLVCKILPNPLDWGECPENRDKYIDFYGDSCGEKNYKSYELAGMAGQQGQQQGQQQQGQQQQRPQQQQPWQQQQGQRPQQRRPKQQQRPQQQQPWQQQQQQQQQPGGDWQDGF
ncbi:hypothetical protein CP532_0732 [Ophiocordyceps camponoti-leonardi (nom. inval.)]|nr:hypothetical protein CP532_0732 [Ophiocordyceps camponoti-leonardi (nom. inval.)]